MNKLLVYKNIATGNLIIQDTVLAGLPKAAVEISISGDIFRIAGQQFDETARKTLLDIFKDQAGRTSVFARVTLSRILRTSYNRNMTTEQFTEEIRNKIDTGIYRDGVYESARNNKFAMQWETSPHAPKKETATEETKKQDPEVHPHDTTAPAATPDPLGDALRAAAARTNTLYRAEDPVAPIEAEAPNQNRPRRTGRRITIVDPAP